MILEYFRQISTFFDIILIYKRMNWGVDRRVAELREGRRTECAEQRAIRDHDLQHANREYRKGIRYEIHQI